jgi:hypothetical protein
VSLGDPDCCCAAAHNISLGLLTNNQTTGVAFLQSQITNLGVRVTATEAFGARLSTAESNIIGLQGSTSANTNSIGTFNTQLQTRATAQSVTDVAARVTTLETNSVS